MPHARSSPEPDALKFKALLPSVIALHWLRDQYDSFHSYVTIGTHDIGVCSTWTWQSSYN
jgi:hypothetical protein